MGLLTRSPTGHFLFPGRELLAQPGITELGFAPLITLFLQRQGLVVDEPARSREAAHLPLLLAVWHQFVLESLEALHDLLSE